MKMLRAKLLVAAALLLATDPHTQVRYELAANLPLVGDTRPAIPAVLK